MDVILALQGLRGIGRGTCFVAWRLQVQGSARSARGEGAQRVTRVSPRVIGTGCNWEAGRPRP